MRNLNCPEKGLKISIISDKFSIIEVCPLCNKGEFNELFTLKAKPQKDNLLSNYISNQTFSGQRCINCGLIFLSPILNQEELNNYYQSLKIDNQVDKSLYKPVMDVIRKYKKEGNFLDVGFGPGAVLELAKGYGFKPYGVEISKEAISHLRGKGFKTYEGEFLDLELPLRHFDVITLLSVIEHIKNPREAIIKCYNLLKEDGILAITVPNFGLSARILKGRWLYLTPYVGHIYCFTPRVVSQILKEANFLLVEMKISQFDPELVPSERSNSYLNFARLLMNSLNSRPFYYLRQYLKIGDAIFVIASKPH